MSDESPNVAEQLMSALINKMESMDAGLQSLKEENAQLKKMMNNPSVLLRKAGFVAVNTQHPEDVIIDGFRGEVDDSAILKGADGLAIGVPTTNEDFHKMDWADIHALAEQAKSAGAVGNEIGME